MFKYGLYEVFKDMYMNIAGEEASTKYKGAIWLAGSASAEFFADIALCPLEMTKVKIQTSPAGTFPIPTFAALSKMSATSAETRFPFGSLVPLWSRQVSRLTARNAQPPADPDAALDPLHDGQVLLLRVHRQPVLHPRLHRAQGQLQQDHAARRHLRVRLHRRCRLRHRLAPCRFGRLAHGQGGEQGQEHRRDRLGGRLCQPCHQGSRHACHHDRYSHWYVILREARVYHSTELQFKGFQWWIYDSFKTAMGMGTTGGK